MASQYRVSGRPMQFVPSCLNIPLAVTDIRHIGPSHAVRLQVLSDVFDWCFVFVAHGDRTHHCSMFFMVSPRPEPRKRQYWLNCRYHRTKTHTSIESFIILPWVQMLNDTIASMTLLRCPVSSPGRTCTSKWVQNIRNLRDGDSWMRQVIFAYLIDNMDRLQILAWVALSNLPSCALKWQPWMLTEIRQ